MPVSATPTNSPGLGLHLHSRLKLHLNQSMEHQPPGKLNIKPSQNLISLPTKPSSNQSTRRQPETKFSFLQQIQCIYSTISNEVNRKLPFYQKSYKNVCFSSKPLMIKVDRPTQHYM